MIELIVADAQTYQPAQPVDLVIADPPYNYGQAYAGYADRLSRDEYLAFSRRWLAQVTASLQPQGALWLVVPDEWVSELDLMARQDFAYTKQNHVVWYYTFGQAQQRKFSRSHTHLLWLTRHPQEYTFCPEAIRVPSARQAVYGDRRAKPVGKLPDDVWVLHRQQLEPLFGPDADTWLCSRVCGTFHERWAVSPNQLPLALVQRMIAACSRPGDWLYDPFCGTGTTAVAAHRLGRRCIGVDVASACIEAARARLAEEGVRW